VTYKIDDVRVGDVVTYGYGMDYEVGSTRFTRRVSLDVDVDNFISLPTLRCLVEEGWALDDVYTPAPEIPSHRGALALVDQPGDPADNDVGLAISDGEHWRDGKRLWLNLPNPIEALPVPASQLRDVIAEWDRAGYQRGVWERSDNPMRSAVARFINATRAEWERAGIQ